MKELQEINIETIRQMKRDGRGFEAMQTLKAYHEMGERNKERIKKQLERRDKLVRDHYGLCRVCEREATHSVFCEYHYPPNYVKRKEKREKFT